MITAFSKVEASGSFLEEETEQRLFVSQVSIPLSLGAYKFSLITEISIKILLYRLITVDQTHPMLSMETLLPSSDVNVVAIQLK